MLERELYLAFSAGRHGGADVSSAVAAEPPFRTLHVAYRCGKPYASRRKADNSFQSVQLTNDLIAPVRAHKRVNFVDYDVAQTAENADNVRSAVDEHAFKRLRRYLKHALRVIEHFVFVTLRNVAVPMKNGQAGIEKKRVETLKLVVYQAFERRDIKHADR